MDQLTGWGHQHASREEQTRIATKLVDHAFAAVRGELIRVVLTFISSQICASSFFSFEAGLRLQSRNFTREILQAVIQSLEPSDPQMLPRDIFYQCGGYRRRGDRTRNAFISTIFGNITLYRIGFRSWQRGEETIFPLELMLGLTHNVSPALLDLCGRSLGSGGMSQSATLERIREECGVTMGVGRLRDALASLAEDLKPLREEHQVNAIVAMLHQAHHSRGIRKPVLSVGRDGITLRENKNSRFHVATAATVTVYDRSGRRLGTIYLAHPPEPGQESMDTMLTDLLTGIFKQWQGPVPRLSYVTDSGTNEIQYFKHVLNRMRHPVSGRRLEWTRIADFYHASERVWAMADALFLKNQAQHKAAWARSMLKKLKQPNGASRVLHSAASLFHRRELNKTRTENFRKAYAYIQKRTRFMNYSEYKRLNLPRGSGITEAACKTIYTQRLKLSGMRWSNKGASHILLLRTILLSGTWKQTYQASVQTKDQIQILSYPQKPRIHPQIAA